MSFAIKSALEFSDLEKKAKEIRMIATIRNMDMFATMLKISLYDFEAKDDC